MFYIFNKRNLIKGLVAFGLATFFMTFWAPFELQTLLILFIVGALTYAFYRIVFGLCHILLDSTLATN